MIRRSRPDTLSLQPVGEKMKLNGPGIQGLETQNFLQLLKCAALPWGLLYEKTFLFCSVWILSTFSNFYILKSKSLILNSYFDLFYLCVRGGWFLCVRNRE